MSEVTAEEEVGEGEGTVEEQETTAITVVSAREATETEEGEEGPLIGRTRGGMRSGGVTR